ncbi:bacteriohemerythrin [Leptothrix ochracea]|uniref:bacteriohemerythrin n=1 Tax=Leptothrix ochracea TaxID=735331 RepID=UPI0034E270DD
MNQIDIFPWDDHFNTGFSDIDQQHRKLVDLLNQLASQIANGAHAETLESVFDELAAYTVYHFDTEEALWHAHLAGDPAELAHRATHEAFRRDVARLRAALSQTSSHQVAEETLGFLAHWLAAHILEADRSMACMVRGVQQGLSLPAARSRAREEMGGTTRALIDLILSIYGTLSTNTLRLMRELSEHRQATLELNHTRKALQQRDRYQRALLDNFPFLVWLKDENSRILAVNRPFAEACGHSDPDALNGLNDLDIWPADLAEHYRADDLEILRTGQPRSVEEWIEIDGKRRWSETYKSPIKLDGQVIGTVGFARDITSRKETEAALHQQLQFARALNRIADTLVEQDDPARILEDTAHVIGETLGADRALIYDVCFDRQTAEVLCEWLSPDCSINPATTNYPIAAFQQAADHIRQTHQGFMSHMDAVHPLLQADVAGALLHQRLMIRSLLWHPFSFSDNGFYLLALNQLQHRRDWSAQDIEFLESISHEVSVALEKVHLLTERDKAEADLRIAATAFEAQEGIVITDAQQRIVRVNSAYTRITGYTQEEVVGRRPSLVSSGRHDRAFFEAMWRSIQEKNAWEGEIWNRRKDGTLYPEFMVITAVHDRQGQVTNYVGTFTDITERKTHQKQLEFLAHYDPLTGLPNRVLLDDRLRQAMASSRRRQQLLALAFIDLDDFKTINDRHGHEAGDHLLTLLAERMQHCLRESDTLSRLGGDEFVAVLGDLPDPQACVPWVQRLLDAAAQPVAFHDTTLQVSCSIGIAFHAPADARDADQLLREADHAMYQAKQAGRNRYHVFDADQDRAVRSHHESIERIRQALSNEELVLHYQPQVHMRSGKVLGVEALIRWQHPQRGLLLPGQFLPEIEHDAISITLGEWVIDSALRQQAQWHAAGLNLSVSVNVAANHLQQEDFVERLKVLLARYPSTPSAMLKLEVLETSALEDIDHVSTVIADCAALGVHFALDDFGTGYSSLTYLKRLPASVLKIDRSFVRDMLVDPDDLAILEGVLGMATAFRRRAIAEGVENDDLGDMLLALGCEWGQGFGIAKPMPAHDMPAWVASWRPPVRWRERLSVIREDLPLLYAMVELRAWIADLEAHLQTGSATPSLDPHDCRFGLWLDTLGPTRYGQHMHFPQLQALHTAVHETGRLLVEMKTHGASDTERQPVQAQLHDLRDQLIKLLDSLLG